MEWHEFDIDEAEMMLQAASAQLKAMAPSNYHYARLQADHDELETVVDWYHRFGDMELSLLEPAA